MYSTLSVAISRRIEPSPTFTVKRSFEENGPDPARDWTRRRFPPVGRPIDGVLVISAVGELTDLFRLDVDGKNVEPPVVVNRVRPSA